MTDSKTQYPPSYSQRLIEHFKQAGNDKFTFEDVQSLIQEFGQLEFKKRKANSDTLNFGKYRGRKVKDVSMFDKPYLQWLVKQKWLDEKPMVKTEILKCL